MNLVVKVIKAQHTQHGRGGATIQVTCKNLVAFCFLFFSWLFCRTWNKPSMYWWYMQCSCTQHPLHDQNSFTIYMTATSLPLLYFVYFIKVFFWLKRILCYFYTTKERFCQTYYFSKEKNTFFIPVKNKKHSVQVLMAYYIAWEHKSIRSIKIQISQSHKK